jgi:hypothetical protein
MQNLTNSEQAVMLKLFSLGQNMRIIFAVMQLENRGEVVGLRS